MAQAAAVAVAAAMAGMQIAGLVFRVLVVAVMVALALLTLVVAQLQRVVAVVALRGIPITALFHTNTMVPEEAVRAH